MFSIPRMPRVVLVFRFIVCYHGIPTPSGSHFGPLFCPVIVYQFAVEFWWLCWYKVQTSWYDLRLLAWHWRAYCGEAQSLWPCIGSACSSSYCNIREEIGTNDFVGLSLEVFGSDIEELLRLFWIVIWFAYLAFIMSYNVVWQPAWKSCACFAPYSPLLQCSRLFCILWVSPPFRELVY